MSTEELEGGQKKGLESLGQEELVLKCKNLLGIAQKAKKARDDALEELGKREAAFTEEIRVLKQKITEADSSTRHLKKNLLEIQLEFETCQKRTVTLEEETKTKNEQIKQLEIDCNRESEKRKSLELMNSNLNDDLEKLDENTGQLKKICKQIVEEKAELDSRLDGMNKERSEWMNYLNTKYPDSDMSNIKDWIKIVEDSKDGGGEKIKELEILKKSHSSLEEEFKNSHDENIRNKIEIERLNSLIEGFTLEKETLSTEILEVKADKTKLEEELLELKASHDVLLKKMNEVRIETTHLIENSDKLSEENSVLKNEKNEAEERFKAELLRLSKEGKRLEMRNFDLEKEYEHRCTEYKKLFETVKSLHKDCGELTEARNRLDFILSDCKAKNVNLEQENRRLNSKKTVLAEEVEDLKKQNDLLNEENNDLRELFQTSTNETDDKISKLSIENTDLKKQLELKIDEHGKILNELKLELESKEERLQSLNEEMEKVEMLKTSLTNENDKLRNELIEYKQHVEDMVQTNKLDNIEGTNLFKKEIEDIKKELAKEKEEQELLKSELHKHKIQLDLLDKENCKLKEINNTNEVKYKEELESISANLRKELELKNVQFAEKSTCVGKLNGDIQKLEKELNENRIKLNVLVQENGKLKKELDDVNSDYIIKVKYVEELEEELAKIKQKPETKDQHTNALDLVNDNIEKLEKDLKESRIKIDLIEEENNTLKSKLDEVSCDNSVKAQHLEKVNLTMEDLKKKLEIKQTQIDMKTKSSADMENSIKEKDEIISVIRNNLKYFVMEVIHETVISSEIEGTEKLISENTSDLDTNINKNYIKTLLECIKKHIETEVSEKNAIKTKLENLIGEKEKSDQSYEEKGRDLSCRLEYIEKEVDSLVSENTEMLPDIFDTISTPIDMLRKIITYLKDNITERNSRLEILEREISTKEKSIEDVILKNKEKADELNLFKRILKPVYFSCKQSTEVSTEENILERIATNSQLISELCAHYSKTHDVDYEEAFKCIKAKLNDMKDDNKLHSSEGQESTAEQEVSLKEKDEQITRLQNKVKELKMVAVKMKKKINDLNQQLEGERQKVESERTKLNQLSAVAKNAQMLQQECDRLVDELEESKKALKHLQKTYDTLEISEKEIKQKYNEKETALETNEKEVTSLRTQLKILQNKEVSLQKELDESRAERRVEEVIRKECEKELIIIQDKHRKTQLELDQVRAESEKHTVLSQEMHDYEQQFAHSQKCIAQLEIQLKEQGITLTSLTEQLEMERREKDNLALQLTNITSDGQKTIESVRLQNEALINSVGKLETDLRSSETRRIQLEEESERINQEFAAYKVRAQSVLRQREQGGGAAEQEAKYKCTQLEELYDRTKSQLDITLNELEKVKSKLSSGLSEKEAIEKKCENVNNILVQRNKELDRQISEHRQHKLSTDTLIQCYKTQLEEKERGYQLELESLRLQLAKLSMQLNLSENRGSDNFEDMVNKRVDLERSVIRPVSENPSQEDVTNGNNMLPLRPPLIEREDGEGSEGNELSVSPSSHQSHRTGMVPLEKLLSQSLPDDDQGILMTEKLETLKVEVTASHTRVRHLSALLSEAEKDSARMEEQNSVLKEEIRRLQRCIERQPHAHNTEYLKNVVFKFVTLHSGDERSRLVPVLDTILKLSPEEHKQLSAVAKGESESGTTSWSVYLPSWQ